MSSSLTCCSSVLEESTPPARLKASVRLDGFQSGYESCRSTVPGFEPDLAGRTAAPARRKREFTPEELKDETYWLKRSRNNESAKRSRLRRRMEESLLEVRAVELLRENEKLKAALSALHYHNNGVKNHFSGNMTGQGLCRDAYVPRNLSGTDGVCCGFSSRAQKMQHLGSNYDSVCLSGMENFSFPSSNYISASFMENQIYLRDRNTGCQLGGSPSYRDGNSVCPSQCFIPPVPAAYDEDGFDGMYQRHTGFIDMSSSKSASKSLKNLNQANSYQPDPLNQREMMVVAPHGPSIAENGPAGYGVAHIQAQGPIKSPLAAMSQAANEISSEMKDINKQTQPPTASGTPLLPHKLRYKASRASKAWCDAN